jgi:hypothetical protein
MGKGTVARARGVNEKTAADIVISVLRRPKVEAMGGSCGVADNLSTQAMPEWMTARLLLYEGA